MDDSRKPTEALIQELNELRERNSELSEAVANQKNIEKTLRDTRAEMAAILENAPMSVVVMDAEILSKPARLNEQEFAFIRNHPGAGFEVLKDIEFPWPLARAVLQHHERLDGSGYPDGISGRDIIVGAGSWPWPTWSRPWRPTGPTGPPWASTPPSRRSQGSGASCSTATWWRPASRPSGRCASGFPSRSFGA
jgi:hypothetical protein